jgi:hypothetical protein
VHASTSGDVAYFPRSAVEAAFSRGAPLVENDAYKIHASRRVEPGIAEVHVLDTDLIYVREGSAVLVTGGRVVDPREIAPQEIRGPSIVGGREREIGPGDVVTVPNGTPHWFRAVNGPLLYYVVKVTDARSAR